MQQPRTPGGRGSGQSAGRRSAPRATGARSGAAGRGAPRAGAARTAVLHSGGSRGASAGRSPGRPSGARRTAGTGGGAALRTRAPQPRRFTGRAAVLGLLLLGLLLAYAYPVRVYMAQQAEITALQDQQDKQRKTIDALTERRAKWDDPAYVTAQARRRLHYVLPGETPYIVIGSQPGPDAGADTTPAGQPVAAPPWYAKLWSSVAAADRP
jgi:cell division protein FtsB